MRRRCLFGVGVLVLSTGVARADDKVRLTVRGTPLRAALQQLFAGSGQELRYPADLPNPAVDARIDGVPRATALRLLLRAASTAHLIADVLPGSVTIRQRPALPPPAGLSAAVAAGGVAGGGTLTTPFNFQLSAPTGFSTGPNGQRIPNHQATQVGGTRRSAPGVPAQVGGIAGGDRRASGTRIPGLYSPSRTNAATNRSSGTFITVTPIPDPAESGPPR